MPSRRSRPTLPIHPTTPSRRRRSRRRRHLSWIHSASASPAAPDPNALDPTAVSVRLRDGQNHAVTLDKVLGNPAKPCSRDQHLEKFRRNWRSGARPLSEADGERLIALIDNLEDVADVSEIVGLLRP